MGSLLIDLPPGKTPTIFLLDPSTLEIVGEEAGYSATNVEIDGDQSRFYTVDVGALGAGEYLVASKDPTGSGWVNTAIGSSPWPVVDGVASRLNIKWIGGLPVVLGDLAVTVASALGRRCGKLPIYWGEDHLAAEARELTVDGIEDSLVGATGELTVKDEDGSIVLDHIEASSVDTIEGSMKFPLSAADAEAFDLSKNYFFFAQAVFENGHKITVKRGEVLLLDTAESSAKL